MKTKLFTFILFFTLSPSVFSYNNFLTQVAAYPPGACTSPGTRYDSCNQPGEFNCPEQMSFWGDKLLIGDSDNYRIQIVDHNGQYISEIPNLGAPHHSIPAPDGGIYVANTYSGNILKYNPQLTLEYAFFLPNPENPLSFLYPESLALSPDGNLFIRTQGAGPSYLLKWNPNTREILNRAMGDDLEMSYNVAIGPNGFLFSGGHEYDQNLNLISPQQFQIPVNAPPEEQLEGHRGLTIDPYGHILVAQMNGKVKIFERTGKLISYLDLSFPLGEGMFHPLLMGIAINPNGEVFVTNCGSIHSLGDAGELIKFQLCIDEDHDGKGLYCPAGNDCNDHNATQGNYEICGDGKDNNCNGLIDEGCSSPSSPTQKGRRTSL